MLTVLLFLACTGPRPSENPTEAAAAAEERAVAEEPGAEEAAKAAPDDDADLGRPLPRGFEESRGTVQTSPSASLPRTAEPGSGSPGCVPQCVAKRAETSGLSASRLQLECMRSCGANDFVIRDARGVAKGSGARVAIEGQIQEVESAGKKGYGLVLRDGSRVWVTYGAPPHGWGDLEGREVRVIGTLWDGPPPAAPGSVAQGGIPEPHLVDWESPIPLRAEPVDTGEEEQATEAPEPAPEPVAEPAPEPLPAP
jgi:hypothetical protein